MLGTSHRRDYVKLHFIVFLWGMTAILGRAIDLPAVEVVTYRVGMAAAVLAVIMRRGLRIPRLAAVQLTATGGLIGLHWILFFLAVKISNVSVCMVGVATVSLWTAIVEPLLIRGRRVQPMDLAFGICVIGAVALIFQSQLKFANGFLVAIAAAMVGAIFSVINGLFAQRYDHRTITFYEMVGAFVFCVLCLPISARWLSGGRGIDLVPTAWDLANLIILATMCTVYAYSEYVELLKRMSVFTVNFANNLEPVYGMILAAIIFGEYETLDWRFYAGASAIAILVLAQSQMKRRKPSSVSVTTI